ncbi:ankyrin repeat-containing domain protein [Coniochaeta sp. 2T2.1]|nr:ankyrin repeat-containing domain protein [Coniochaeta sp. 2T2.1]
MSSVQGQAGPVADEAIDTSEIWRAAIDQYEKTTGVRITALNGVNSIEGILAEVNMNEKRFMRRRHNGSKSDRLRTLLSQSFRPIEQLLIVATQASKGAFPPSEAIFAAIRYLITSCWASSRRRLIVKTLRSLVSGEDVELKSARDRFHKLVEREEGIVLNAILVGIAGLKSNVQSAHTDGRTRVGELKLGIEAAHADVTNGLSGIADNLQTILTNTETGLASAEETGDTLQSVLAETKQKWLNGKQNSTLWCPGDAGAGKTVMVSAVVDCIDTMMDRSKVVVALVYCNYSDPSTRSEVGILSSIIRQLVEQCKVVPAEIRAFRDKYAGRLTRPTVEERIALIRLLARPYDRTYILIDALDECSKEDRVSFLRSISQLERIIRLLVTSRPVLDLQGRFSCLCRIDIAAHESDIRAYLESAIDGDESMQRFTSKDPNLKEDIVNSLQVMADGMRPLTTGELLHALSVESGDTDLCEAALPDTELLLGSSAGLIRADKQTGIVGLVHKTLHEYFKMRPDQLLSWPEREMARVCLTYLTFDEFNSGPCDVEEGLDRRLHNYRFFDYASHHWGSHFHHNQTDTSEDMDLLQGFLLDSGKLSSSIQVLYMSRHRAKGWYDRFPKQVSPLHAAAYWDLDKAVAKLLEEKADINHQDSYGATALHLAAQKGHVLVACLLLDHAANINMVDNRGRTPVAWAGRNGHQGMVELLVARGADTLGQDDSGWTVLHWATMGGYAELAKFLLSHTTGLERTHRNRALALAAEAGSVDIIRMLLDGDDNGTGDDRAEVDWRDQEGSTPMTFSIPLGYEEAVSVFLERGADVNALDNFDNAPLHWAIAHLSMTRLLLENGADVNAKNDKGSTALHWAVQERQEEVVQVLIEAGADVNIADVNGFRPLHAASLKGLVGIVRLLLANGAKVDVEDQDGWTPLHVAAFRGNDTVVSLLLDSMEDGREIVEQTAELLADGAVRAMWDEKAQEKSAGSTVVSGLRYAANTGHAEMVLALLENGADIDAEDDIGGSTALTVAASLCQLDIMQVLLQNGVDINKPDRSGWTALHHVACSVGGLDLVKLLVENGADIEARVHRWTPLLLAGKYWLPSTASYLVGLGADVNAEDYHGRRILHWAAWNGGRNLTQLVLDQGANVNAGDRWGRTSLTWAVEGRKRDVTKLLLEHGADATLTARDGTTALHRAALVGDRMLADYLLAEGADCNARAVGGLTALHVAAFMGHQFIVELLLKSGADASDENQWRVQECIYEGFDTSAGIDPAELLCSQFRNLVHEYGDTGGIENDDEENNDDEEKDDDEDETSFNTQQLAVLGGSTAVLRLLAMQRNGEIESCRGL